MVMEMEMGERGAGFIGRRGGGWRDLLSLPGAAQGCWRRLSETKHDASEAEGPSSKAKEKKGRVTPGGGGREGEGGGRREITHPLVCIESDKVQNSSGFSLRCNRVNGLEISEAAAV